MYIANTLSDLHLYLEKFQCPAFVPTMGNLHDGHLALVSQAKTMGDVVVVSIFVNRLQFLPNEDFNMYPRSLEMDAEKLKNVGCDVLFAPAELDLYPQPQKFRIQPDSLIADALEGHFRPGFFTGVCTVVLKLFNVVFAYSHGRGVAVFGKKDYQQLMVIRAMVRQFCLPIDVVACETLRAKNGLALSSRNGYLSPVEKEEAVQLSLALKKLAHDFQSLKTLNAQAIEGLEKTAMQTLSQRGWSVDYLTIRHRQDLCVPTISVPNQSVVLGAAKIGNTRLIDNFEF